MGSGVLSQHVLYICGRNCITKYLLNYNTWNLVHDNTLKPNSVDELGVGVGAFSQKNTD